MKSLANNYTLNFCQHLVAHMEQDVRPMGKAKGPRGEELEFKVIVLVPDGLSPSEVIAKVVAAAKMMAEKLNSFAGPLEFVILQRGSISSPGDIVNIVRMNSMCIQHKISYRNGSGETNNGRALHEFAVKYRGRKVP